MPSKDDKYRRKQILDDMAEKQKEEFNKSLTMSRDMFVKLFDFLNEKLVNCDDTLKLTESFLSNNNISDKGTVITWLGENGGYCDCEVLANVEEHFN